MRKLVRIQIITSHFANCEMNSSYCNCKVVNRMKIVKQFYFSLRKIQLVQIIFFHIISFIFSSTAYYYQKKYCLCRKLRQKMKNVLQFLKIFTCGGVKASLRSAYLFQITWVSHFPHLAKNCPY